MYLVVQKIVHSAECIFATDIKDTLSNTKKCLFSQEIVSFEHSIIQEVIHSLFEYHIWRLCQKTLIYEFHKYRRRIKIPVNPSSSKAFDAFVALIDETMIRDWFQQYKCLGQMVTKSVKIVVHL
jgi:lantibiotic modifying enzyme